MTIDETENVVDETVRAEDPADVVVEATAETTETVEETEGEVNGG